MTISPSITGITCISAATVATVTALLAWRYPDRAVFHEHRTGLIDLEGTPILGNLPSMVKNLDKFYDYLVDNYEKLNTMTLYGYFFLLEVYDILIKYMLNSRTTAFLMPNLIYTADPRNVEHILKGM